jgi:exodeoxyribonuclease V beta subunit
MNLDLAKDDITHGLVIEASAGTGKTYSVAALVTRELALRDDLRIGQILITTFTRNAAAELRDRIRRRLVETVRKLRGELAIGGDEIAALLGTGDAVEVVTRARRLERAVVEFDSATISTIHGVCSRVLRTAGIDVGRVSESDETDRIVAEVVNDFVVTHAAAGDPLDEGIFFAVVKAMLGDPFIEPWIDPAFDEATKVRLSSLKALLVDCVARIKKAMAASPSYNDLLRLAHEVVCDESRPELLGALRKRFKLAIIDEAQDTDKLQWRLFERLFPGGDGRALVSVGDPKQAIYGFRGADVRAYVDHAKSADVHRTLTTNRRSDQPVLDALNQAFDGATFGADIAYVHVRAPGDRQESLIRTAKGDPKAPVDFIELGVATNQSHVVAPVVGAVVDLLDDARLAPKENPQAPGRPLEPRDICVLVRSGAVGQSVSKALGRAGIPAVAGGTSSVMASEMASDIRSLFEAMESPSNTSRARRAAATVFFGHSLANVGVLTEETLLEVQEGVMMFATILERKGLASLGATIEADDTIMKRVAAGRHGERNLTDFLHVMEVMDASGPSGGCTAEQAIAIFVRLAAMDDTHDLVSRRVESDADAVKILTIHGAKGLQFPCVIVADLWKGKHARPGSPAVFYGEKGPRKLDLGFAIGSPSDTAKLHRQAAEDEESRRLLYVAATRAEHYLAILVGRAKPTKDGLAAPSILEQTINLPALVAPSSSTRLTRRLTDATIDTAAFTVAPVPTVTTTFKRMSFTGIAAIGGHRRPHSAFEPEASGHDEPSLPIESDLPDNSESGEANHQVIEIPAGVAVGRIVHEIFEHVDTTARPLADEVRRVVAERATAGRLRDYQPRLAGMITEALETPLGGPFGAITLAAIPPTDRLPEMNFEMGLASLTDGVVSSDIGKVLQAALPADDLLRGYADVLASHVFDVALGGLLTGSIDAVLRLPESTSDRPRLLIVDYKSNKLHKATSRNPMAAYRPDLLAEAMAKSHYPLQALLYGTALYRMLRWRLPDADPDDCIVGVAYAFIRGMKGIETPVDERGHRYGVFTWQAPRGLWGRLSDLLVVPPVPGGVR